MTTQLTTLCMQVHDSRDYQIMLDRTVRKAFCVSGRGLFTVARALNSAVPRIADDTRSDRSDVATCAVSGVTYPKAVYVEAGITPSRGEIEGMQGS